MHRLGQSWSWKHLSSRRSNCTRPVHLAPPWPLLGLGGGHGRSLQRPGRISQSPETPNRKSQRPKTAGCGPCRGLPCRPGKGLKPSLGLGVGLLGSFWVRGEFRGASLIAKPGSQVLEVSGALGGGVSAARPPASSAHVSQSSRRLPRAWSITAGASLHYGIAAQHSLFPPRCLKTEAGASADAPASTHRPR